MGGEEPPSIKNGPNLFYGRVGSGGGREVHGRYLGGGTARRGQSGSNPRRRNRRVQDKGQRQWRNIRGKNPAENRRGWWLPSTAEPPSTGQGAATVAQHTGEKPCGEAQGTVAFSMAEPPSTGQGSLWHSDKQDKKITALVSMMLIASNKCGKSAARLAFFCYRRKKC